MDSPLAETVATEEQLPASEETQGSERGFWGLIGLQLQGAFSDNVFKQVLILLILVRSSESESDAGRWTAIITALFAIPYLIFAGWSGSLSDRFSKRHVILGTKVAEVFIMAIGGITLYLYTGVQNPADWAFYAAVCMLFLMATQSCFFSPSKYGILPEILPLRRLTWGNGIIEMTTFVSIILGVVVANLLCEAFGLSEDSFEETHLERISMILVFLAFVGFASGLFIQKVPPARPDLKIRANHFPQLWGNMKIIMADRILFLTVLGISYFWFLGAIILANTPIWGINALELTVVQSGMLMAVMALGIGAGSITVGALSRSGIEIGFVPLGALGIAVFSLPLALAQPAADSPVLAITMIALLGMVGFSAGFYSVPLNAMLQHRAGREVRGGVIAALNFVNFSGILLSSLFFWVLIDVLGFTAANIFAIISLVTFGATLFLVILMPEALMGLVAILITRLVYRIQVLGKHNIPKEGPALLVCNHVSLVDALLLLAISPRRIRFIVWKEFFDNPILGYFLKIMRAIPVSSDMHPRALIASLTVASEALKNGELVCIFAEGQITRTGLMLPFRRGFKHILTKAPAPVIPIYLDGVWGSIFSFERKKFIWKWPRQIPYHVRIAVGEALPHDVSMHEMRQSVLQLSADCALVKKSRMRPVHHRFIRNARKHWGHFCVADSRTPPLKCGRTLLGSIILARRLRKHWGDQTRVGIFLPPSVGAVLTNIAAAISGRTAVNLNYTTGPDVLAHCIETAGLKTVVTAHEFLEKLKMEPPPGAIYIDDIGKQKRRLSEVIGAIFAARLLPIRALESYCGAREHPSNDSLITIIFSSGSTGMPKGVMLSHFNIASNLESFEQAISLWPDDRLIGFLPFFHSFGYTVSLWGGLCIRYGVIHHTNPMEAKVIGDLVEQYGVTVMVGTPTFLQHYIRKVEPRKFGSLEFVLTGAEKLHERTANAFQERFGIYVYEGYGTTECSPIVSINVDDYRSRGFHQVGNKRGSVGHPIPGVVVRITDIETAELLPGGERGMIQVRGPNIMQGYLGMEEKTAEVLKDGWYDTGDVGYIDEEGFIHITDRLARFSKIGGEMIPHLRIEEELHQAIGATEQVFVVTAIPDLSKGERLAVLYTVEEGQLEGIAGKLGEAGLPNLWIPRADMFFRVEQIPILGTGKLDLSEIRRIALRSSEPEAASTQ